MVKKFGRLALLICWLGILTTALSAQGTPDTTKDNVILIDHVGNLIEDKQGLERVRWLSQGIQLRIDSTFIYADTGVIFGEDRLRVYRDVVIQQGDSLNVFTDTLLYFKDRDVAHLIGEVVLEHGSQQLWTNYLTYYLGDRYAEYNNGGILIDKGLQVSSRRGTYRARSQEVMFRDSVVVLHPEFNLAADSLRYLAAEEKVVFTGPTNFYTKAASIYCEGGFYDRKTDVAEFNVNPHYTGKGKKGTADTIRYIANAGQAEMFGNVIVEELDRQITGGYLKYLEKTGETWIKGSPAVYEDSIHFIKSEEIFFNEKTNQVRTLGAGEVNIEAYFIKSDIEFSYDESTGILKATGNADFRDTLQNIGVKAEYINANQEKGYMLAYGDTISNKRALFYTIIEGDTLFIAADTLNKWKAIDTLTLDTTQMMRMYHDVRLFKSDMQGLTDSLVYNERDSMFTFFGEPVLWSDTTQFTGDSIYMHLQNSKIRDITLNRSALIVSEILDTYYDQIKGKSIVAVFDSSEVKNMTVSGNAESIYYTRDDQSAFIGVNKTICSKMYFTFTGGEIHLLKYYGDNTSSLLPMHETDHRSMRLEGFHWREAERPRSLNDLLK